MSFNNKHEVMDVGPVDMDASVSHAVGTVQGTIEIQQVDLHNSASGASHAVNYVTYNLINGGTDGTGTAVIATADTSGTNFPAFAPFNLPITGDATVTDGQTLIIERAEENTDAPAQDACVVQVRYLQTVAP